MATKTTKKEIKKNSTKKAKETVKKPVDKTTKNYLKNQEVEIKEVKNQDTKNDENKKNHICKGNIALILSIIAIIFSLIPLLIPRNNIKIEVEETNENVKDLNSFRLYLDVVDIDKGYIVLNDREFLEKVVKVFKEHKQGYTYTKGNGGWVDENDKYHSATSYIIDVFDISKEDLKNLGKALANELNIGSIIVEEANKKFVSIKNPVLEEEPEN